MRLKLPLIVIILVSFVLISGCITEIKPHNIVLTKNIYSLERDTATSGYFILGSGIVESKPVYYYYENTGKNMYKLRWIDAQRCTIVLDDNVTPFVIAEYAYENSRSTHFLFGDIGDYHIARNINITNYNHDTDEYTIIQEPVVYTISGDAYIHVPSNSLIKEFNP